VDVRVAQAALAPIDLAEVPPIDLGTIRIVPVTHEVHFGDISERIQAQPMRVLIALAQNPGTLVTREALVALCWGGRILGDDVINRAILILRGVAKRSGAFGIQTIPRAGYRLVLQTAAQPRHTDRRRRISIVAGAAVLAAFGAAILIPRQAQQTAIVRVLPIESHLQGPDRTRLPGKVRASLIHALMDSGFAVDAVGRARPPSANVDFEITGQLSEGDGRIHASIQMEDARRGMLILSREFDRPVARSGAIAEEIAANIAANVAGIASPMSLSRRQPVNSVTLTNLLNLEYLDGTGTDPLRAYDIARRTAPQAPHSGLAQIALAISAGLALPELPERDRPRALAEGRAAAASAQRLAPDFGDNAVAWCLLHPRAEFGACESHLRSALKADPDAPTVPLALSVLLQETGQYDDALRMAEIASAGDPFNPMKLDFRIQALEIAGDSSEAERVAVRGQRWWPDHQQFTWNRVMGMAARGDFAALERLDRITPVELIPYDRAIMQAVLAAARNHDVSRMKSACLQPRLKGSTRQVCMAALLKSGDVDSAFAIADGLYPPTWDPQRGETERLWLQRPETFLLTFLSSPAAARMRKDPRFKKLAGQSGLIAYWRVQRPDFCKTEDCGPLLAG